MRFTTRDMLWLTAVLAVALGWFSWWRSLPVPEDGLIQGFALVAGKPIDNGRFFLHCSDGRFFGGQVDKGRFSLQNVPFGQYQLVFEGEDIPPNKFPAELDRSCRALGWTFDIR